MPSDSVVATQPEGRVHSPQISRQPRFGEDGMPWNWVLRIGRLVVLAGPLLWFGAGVNRRPPQTTAHHALFQGVQYHRTYRPAPRPTMLHVVKVNLAAPGLQVLVTPGQARALEWETNARTTSAFLREFKLQLAVNANFFHPFAENTPWDYYPRMGDRVGVVGQAISNAVEYGPPLQNWPVLCFLTQAAQILATETCPKGTQHAVAGSTVIVAQGQPAPNLATLPQAHAYSRTAIALDRSGKTLWIVIVDAKQWGYSEGITLAELAEVAIAQGADTALNLDGGGSATLVTATSGGPKVLNAPAHAKIPMQERPVANHIGFYARPLTP